MPYTMSKNAARASSANYIITIGTVIITVLFCVFLRIFANLLMSLMITVIAVMVVLLGAASTTEE